MKEKIIIIESKENFASRQNNRVRLRKLKVRREGDRLIVIGVSQKDVSTSAPPLKLDLDEAGANAFVQAIGAFHFMNPRLPENKEENSENNADTAE